MIGWVYPHECGGTRAKPGSCGITAGLSPRVWGNHDLVRLSEQGRGSIPTGVGEPASRRDPDEQQRVYPHGCGGTAAGPLMCCPGRGLSPRVWGNRNRGGNRGFLKGSIPTGVGEPAEGGVLSVHTRVYPHGCGGTLSNKAILEIHHGLSPRVWGNRNMLCRPDEKAGSIPTGVGEPRSRPGKRLGVLGSIPTGVGEPGGQFPLCGRHGVYPHGCGGT